MFTASRQKASQIEARGRVTRLRVDRLVSGGDRVVEPVELSKHIADIHVGACIARRDCYRVAVTIERAFQLAVVLENISLCDEAVGVCIGRIRVGVHELI